MSSIDFGKNDVLGLQIPVYYSMSVQEFQGQNNLTRVKGHVILELLVIFADLAEHGATFDVLQLEIQIVFILKGAVNAHDEGTQIVHFRKVLKNLTFGDNVINLFHLSHILFFQTLKRTQPLGFLVEGSHNFAEVSNANNFVLLKLFDFGFVCLLYPHFTGSLRRFIIKL